jgi:apolipoprotein N-acyltransferase
VSRQKPATMHLHTRLGGFVNDHPRWAALLLGAVAAFGFQPWRLWPLTILAVAGLIALLARARTARQAALLGWLFGWAHFSVANTWIATAFTYQANMPAWLGAIAVMLLSIYLALFPALSVFAAWILARSDSNRRFWVGALLVPCWIVGEWLRSWVLSGFAWNPLGVALLGGFDTPGLAAVTPWIGTYGLSGMLVGIAALLESGIRQMPRWRWAAVGLLALVVVATGAAMEWPAKPAPISSSALAFTLIQPDIREEVLNDPRFYEDAFVRTATLSAALHPGERRLVLWPESGLPDYLEDGYPQGYYDSTTYAADPRRARERIARVVGANGMLLTGTVDLAMAQGRVFAARNTVTALGANGVIVGDYAKSHLVPFGEYLPFRGVLEPLGAARLVPGDLDFLPGPGPRTLDLGQWGKVGLQVCYEITFSGQVVDETHRPDFIFNPSNDGWFGSWGPPQHLAQARLRGIEEGLPVLRSTTTGISAVVDADGIVRESIARLIPGRIDGRLPPPKPPTLFSRYGNALPLIVAGLLLVISQVAMRYRRH